jgi:hypothetical protein
VIFLLIFELPNKSSTDIFAAAAAPPWGRGAGPNKSTKSIADDVDTCFVDDPAMEFIAVDLDSGGPNRSSTFNLSGDPNGVADFA